VLSGFASVDKNEPRTLNLNYNLFTLTNRTSTSDSKNPDPNQDQGVRDETIVADLVAGIVEPIPTAPSTTRVYSRNVFLSLIKIFVFAASGVLLPAYLTHHVTPAFYGGLVLILQIASYIGYLDLGIQIAVAKYIAQFTAANETAECNQHASAGWAITSISAVVGLVLSYGLSLLVPTLFHNMPADLRSDVARGVLFVGCSTAIMLAASPFAAFFLGLQRYKIPTFLSIANKLIYIVVLVVMVTHHSSLTAVGAAIAIINITTAILQIGAWRLFLPEVRVHPSLVMWPVVKRMLAYCAVLGIWTSGILIITGLDTTIVGHYDFNATAFYAIAATPLTFLGMILQAALNPLMPAVSALSLSRTSGQLGMLLTRSTRYITLILHATGLPLILFGYVILLVWVGPTYAHNSLTILRILVFAQMIRNVFGPYATMVIATGIHKDATWSGVCEAVVNLIASVMLGRYFGAVGVAYGTLIGAVVGVLIHFYVSIPKTQHTFHMNPYRFLKDGVFWPSIMAIPTIVCLPFLWKPELTKAMYIVAPIWLITSVVLAWTTGLNDAERQQFPARVQALRQRFFPVGA
jgi:O-antigen/teichoic acid export membrane protein